MAINAESAITVHYWAAARAAAGCDSDRFLAPSPIPLAEVIALAEARHPDNGLARVLSYCSVLLGDRPVSTEDASELLISPGSCLEFLPPFAGG